MNMEGKVRNIIRKNIIDAAVDELRVYGFEHARIYGIAHRAGINPAALYYYLGNKEEIYSGVYDRAFLYIEDRLIKWIKAEPDSCHVTPDMKFAELLYFMSCVCHDQNVLEIFRLFLYDIGKGGKFTRKYIMQYIIPEFNYVDNILHEGIKQGIFEIQETKLFILNIIFIIIRYMKSKTLSENGLEEGIFSINSDVLYTFMAEYAFKLLKPVGRRLVIPEIDDSIKKRIVQYLSADIKW